jgi:methionine aminotransferase
MFESKLPRVGTTIFSVMTALANEVGATNLSQGFPDFEAHPKLLDLVNNAMRKGFNQYAHTWGLPTLREAIAGKTEIVYGTKVDANTEVTVVSGASEALFNALACLVGKEDEVIILEPAYDLYLPAIELFGGKAVGVPLEFPSYSVNWEKVKQAITPKTKAIIVNTPQNPSGAILTAQDMAQLEAITRGTNIVVISDEVYEHIIFDGQSHESVLKYPALRERSFVISSFGKTYHTTGWKIGYCIAPPYFTTEFRKIHQFNTFATSTPMQVALAEFLQDSGEYLNLPAFYQERRDKFKEMLKATPFEILPCAGTYFQLVGYGHLSQEADTAYTQRITREVGVATIPVSVFYSAPTDHKVIRFCFAKRYETLEQGIEKIIKLADKLQG